MDRSRVETAIRLLEKYRNEIWQSGEDVNSQITAAVCELKVALFEPDADPCDECECEGCRVKTAQTVPLESADGDFEWRKFDPITEFNLGDYETRLKAWNIASGFEFGIKDCKFYSTLEAAIVLYNFLSGQNEDVK